MSLSSSVSGKWLFHICVFEIGVGLPTYYEEQLKLGGWHSLDESPPIDVSFQVITVLNGNYY